MKPLNLFFFISLFCCINTYSQTDLCDEKNKEPCKISIGASFDFINGSSKTDIYYDVSYYMPLVFENSTKKFWKKFGFEACFYQNRIFGDSTTINLKQNPRSIGMQDENVIAAKRTLTRDRIETYENIGLCFNPSYSLVENKIFAFLHFEGIVRVGKIFLNDRYTSSETMLIPKDEFIEPTDPISMIEEGKSEYKLNPDVQEYYGGGFMLDVCKKNVNFKGRASVVYADRDIFVKGNDKLSTIKTENGKGLMLIINAQVVELNAGLKLGGSIRRFFGNDRAAPTEYSIFLSKQFSLSKLGS